MDTKLIKFSLACVTGVLISTAYNTPALAVEYAVAGYPYDKAGYAIQLDKDIDEITSSSINNSEIPIPGFNNIGIANVQTNLLVREKPSENGKIIGKMPKDAGCEILEPDNNGWTKIKSGKVTGYVKSEYLITGPEASKKALEVAKYVATANVDGLRVRKEPSADESVPILDFVAKGEQLLVLDPLVVVYGEEHNKWVKVSLDGDDNELGIVGYVAKEYVDLSYELAHAYTIEELELGPGVSSIRAKLVNVAKKYLGYRYVWGGTSFSRDGGVDCSGFVLYVYRQLGYTNLPRTSREQARSGKTVSQSNLKPGDLVFYGNSSTGYINHVAIYIGNNKVIHASNRRDGIKISNINYRKPIKCVRYIND